jgi:hypothetical protein
VVYGAMALETANGRQAITPHSELIHWECAFHGRGAEKRCARGPYGLSTRRGW